ncbi:MAG: LysR family transcriptional regulator [Candidatus Eremiobacteraeota bacterium]|nr:LysR family transcriptional regulator [Candidatus Eremiobacteraeota bacterium]MCW5871488.1 LysR family transcriptional regulator [Candidatus Eremiobacteraeota bacterium]
MDFNLYPLWVFLQVAQQGGVTRAAEQLKISQPAASAQLKTLETFYGERLLERGPKGTRLTAQGKRLYARAVHLFDDLRELQNLYDQPMTVSIAASHTPGIYWLPRKLSTFAHLCSYEVLDSSQVAERVLEASVPFGLIGKLEHLSGALEKVVVAHDQLHLVGCNKPTAEEKNLILRQTGSSTRTQAEKMLGPELGRFERILELNSTEAIKEAVLAGLGVAVLSSWSIAREMATGHLRLIKPQQFVFTRPIHLIRLRGRRLRESAQALWSHLTAGVVI